MPNQRPFSWVTATAAEISQHCGLDALPLNLIEEVLPRFRAFLDSKHSATANACNTDLAQVPAPAVRSAALALHGNPCPQSVDGSELLSTAQPLASFSSPEQGAIPDSGPTTDIPEWWNMMDGFTWAPKTEPPAAEELTSLLQQQGSAVLEQTIEEGPSAASEYRLDLEHSRAVEAGWGEHRFALPTREDVGRSSWGGPLLSNADSSTELTQGAGMDGICAGDFDFGHLLDGWEGWAELGCPDKL